MNHFIHVSLSKRLFKKNPKTNKNMFCVCQIPCTQMSWIYWIWLKTLLNTSYSCGFSQTSHMSSQPFQLHHTLKLQALWQSDGQHCQSFFLKETQHDKGQTHKDSESVWSLAALLPWSFGILAKKNTETICFVLKSEGTASWTQEKNNQRRAGCPSFFRLCLNGNGSGNGSYMPVLLDAVCPSTSFRTWHLPFGKLLVTLLGKAQLALLIGI